MDDLFLVNEIPGARMRRLTICDRVSGWYEFQSEEIQNLANLDVILMRKDPPLNMQYVYTTYLLELAQKQGVLIVNDPQTLRDANEKLFITWFPQCIVSSLVTRNAEQIRNFVKEHTDIILKPLDEMGGTSAPNRALAPTPPGLSGRPCHTSENVAETDATSHVHRSVRSAGRPIRPA